MNAFTKPNDGRLSTLRKVGTFCLPTCASYTSDGKPASLSEDQYTRLKQMIDDQYSGPSNTGRPMLLEGGLDFDDEVSPATTTTNGMPERRPSH